MSSTQFVEMYHPLIPSTITNPVRVPDQSKDDHAANGWLLVDPEATLPDPVTPYYTTSAADSRFVRTTLLDTAMTAVAADADSDFSVEQRAAFDAWLDEAGGAGGGVSGDALFRHSGGQLRHKLTTNQNCVWTHIGDSTGNATDEWVYLSAIALGLLYPNQKITYELWNDVSETYGAATTVQPGSSGPDPAPALSDTFTRTAAALSGTAADSGQTWTTGPGAVDGSLYDVSAGGADITHGLDPQASGGIRATARYVIASGTTVGNGRLHLGGSGANEVFAECAILSGPTMKLTIFQRVGGTATTVATSTTIPAVTGSTQNCDVVLAWQGTTVTASMTYNGSTVSASGTLSVAGNWPGFAAATNLNISGAAGFKVDSVSVGQQGGTFPVGTLRIINGSKAGAGASYLIPRAGLLSPVPADLVTISTGHNHGTQAVPAYLTDLDNLVAAALVNAPGAGVALSSQNPEFPPIAAPTVAAHLARIQAIKPHAVEKGWGYISVVEKFVSRTDRGQSWVQSDGIHPTTAAGSPAWRDAAMDYLRGAVPVA